MAGEGDRAWCVSCGTRFERGGEGGAVRIRTPSGAEEERRSGVLARAVARAEGGEGGSEPESPLTAEVLVRLAEEEAPVRGETGDLVGFHEVLRPPRPGILELRRELLTFLPARGDRSRVNGDASGITEPLTWRLLEIRAIQTSSKSVQIAPKVGGLVDFRFQGQSPMQWDGVLQRAVQQAYERAGLGEIVEFQPRIVTRYDRPRRAPGDDSLGSEERKSGPPRRPSGAGPESGTGRIPDAGPSWYAFFRALGKLLVLLVTRTEASGVEHVPRAGPFFLVANHQSVLDPILVQTACPRPLHTFTKSTQFSGRFFRWLLIKVKAIPTRRYRIDPQVVRVALRRLAEGKGVGIYPEGERSWDGELQPFRQGTIRLLLKAGVPVVPCGIDGSYDVWPRWSRILRRRRVRVTFGPPLRWPAMEDRASREAALPAASQRLRDALVDLGAWEMGEGECGNP